MQAVELRLPWLSPRACTSCILQGPSASSLVSKGQDWAWMACTSAAWGQLQAIPGMSGQMELLRSSAGCMSQPSCSLLPHIPSPLHPVLDLQPFLGHENLTMGAPDPQSL